MSRAPIGAPLPLPARTSSALREAAVSQGLGTTRPAMIHLGGASSSGIITDLRWTSWGGQRAEGTGSAAYLPPGVANAEAVRTRATVVASDLRVRNGRAAYRRLTTYFPAVWGKPRTGMSMSVPSEAASGEWDSPRPTHRTSHTKRSTTPRTGPRYTSGRSQTSKIVRGPRPK